MSTEMANKQFQWEDVTWAKRVFSPIYLSETIEMDIGG
jgi:hypothetical protein